MTKAVTIVDYDVGNLLSVKRALENFGATVTITGERGLIGSAERLVLPGVGAFGDCIKALRERKLEDVIKCYADNGRPFLGICVGMQLMFERGEEFGSHEGLGLIPGSVVAIPKTSPEGRPHKIPHIGWAPLALPAGLDAGHWRGTILHDVAPGASVYFVHSYTAQPEHAEHRLSDVSYDGRLISAAVRRDHKSGTQFHPEKSGPVGLAIVRRFLEL